MGLWAEVPAFLLGLVTLAITTNAFARRSTRRLRQLKGQAELLNLLPEGPGASALARHLDDAVADLVEGFDTPGHRGDVRDGVLVVVAIVAGIVWIGGASTAVVWEDRPGWVQSVSLAGLVVVALCTAVMALLNRRRG